MNLLPARESPQCTITSMHVLPDLCSLYIFAIFGCINSIATFPREYTGTIVSCVFSNGVRREGGEDVQFWKAQMYLNNIEVSDHVICFTAKYILDLAFAIAEHTQPIPCRSSYSNIHLKTSRPSHGSHNQLTYASATRLLTAVKHTQQQPSYTILRPATHHRLTATGRLAAVYTRQSTLLG